MDLRQFYLEHVSEGEYYYKFYDLVKNINKTYNIFRGEEETNDYKFEVYDIEEAIEKFKYLCMPENESHSNEDRCWFYLILFYLNKCGFIIKEFPRLIDRPPEETYDFVNKEIRNKLISEGKDNNGTVRYRDRRVLVANMTFHQREAQIELSEAVERKFEEISNRGASFQNMSMDEKLAEIANLIENLLKKNGKFLLLDYAPVCFDYINDKAITAYRKQIQCFRHSAAESISERRAFTNEQKSFLIDYGLTVVKAIHALLPME